MYQKIKNIVFPFLDGTKLLILLAIASVLTAIVFCSGILIIFYIMSLPLIFKAIALVIIAIIGLYVLGKIN